MSGIGEADFEKKWIYGMCIFWARIQGEVHMVKWNGIFGFGFLLFIFFMCCLDVFEYMFVHILVILCLVLLYV